MMTAKNDLMDKLVSLCKRRGYIFQSSEIYGGLNSCYDYGPLGAELKRNLKDFWWKSMTQVSEDIEGLDSSILMHPRIWEASGHVENFTDPLIDCKQCKHRFRADQVETPVCPDCGGPLTEARSFNLMFKTFMGPVEDAAAIVYLRPETAQGIYVNFPNVQASARRKLPFGIAQIGKAFRNEITPGNFIFRTREFEQMEMQFFVRPGEDETWMETWKERRMAWHKALGLDPNKLEFHQHGPGELAHYAKSAFDVRYEFPFGWQEIEGVHNRTDFDLRRHTEFSGKKLEYFDDQRKEHFLPYIIETSAGCDRILLTLLVNGYAEEEERTVLHLAPHLAPIKAAVFPLVNKDGMPEFAERLVASLRRRLRVTLDTSGAIGRRYRRQDEIGTPFCVTVDGESLGTGTVTLRERDGMTQERVAADRLCELLETRTFPPYL